MRSLLIVVRRAGLCLGLGLALVGAANLAKGEANRPDVELVVVESGKANRTREEWQRAFLAQMKVELEKRGVHAVTIGSAVVSARGAAEQLRAGRCDGAVLVGDDRPFALRRLGGTTLAAELSRDDGRQSVYLFLGEGRGKNQAALRESFDAVMADRAFLALVQGAAEFAPTVAAAR